MTDNPDLSAPLPEWWTDADLDRQRLADLLLENVRAQFSDLESELLSGALIARFEPFDEYGWTTLHLNRKSGEETELNAQCHWSAITKAR